MTRFFVRTDVEESEKLLSGVLEKLGSSWKVHTPGIVSSSPFDNETKEPLLFTATTVSSYKLLLTVNHYNCGSPQNAAYLQVKYY